MESRYKRTLGNSKSIHKRKGIRRLLACEKLEKERQSSQCRQQIFTSEQQLNTVRRRHSEQLNTSKQQLNTVRCRHSEQLNTVRNQHSKHETNMIDQWKKQHDKVCRQHLEHIDRLWGTIKEKENEIAEQREQHQQELQRLRQEQEEYKRNVGQQFNQMKDSFDNFKF